MNKIITSIILLAVTLALIISSILPVARQIRNTGDSTFEVVKNMNTSIKP